MLNKFFWVYLKPEEYYAASLVRDFNTPGSKPVYLSNNLALGLYLELGSVTGVISYNFREEFAF